MMINVNLRMTAFCESGPLINIVVKLLAKQSLHNLHGGINERERHQLEKELKNLKISVTHHNAKRYYRISSISNHSRCLMNQI